MERTERFTETFFFVQKDLMCSVLTRDHGHGLLFLITEKSEQFFVYLSDIFKVDGETAFGRYCFTGNRGKELSREKTAK